MKIGPCDLDARVFVVAEAGVNHEGSVDTALALVDAAADSGADAVKFQTYRTEAYIAASSTERFARMKRFELSPEAFQKLAARAKARNILFLSTPLDEESVEVLDPLVPAFKIASGDLTNLPLLSAIASKGKPIILSTGVATMAEIESALSTFRSASQDGPLEERVVLLHCISSYPAPPEEINLHSIPFMRRHFKLRVGYSDHTLGTLACHAAVALGARVIEKHFTLSRANRVFRDHALSLEPHEMKTLVGEIHSIEKTLGRLEKSPGAAESKEKMYLRRSLAARRPIAQGDSIRLEFLSGLRPQEGIPIEEISKVVGKTAARDIRPGEILQWKDLR